MEKYIKKTKENTNIPEWCLHVLKKIQEKFNDRNINLDVMKSSFNIPIVTSDKYPYCFDAIKVVQRTFIPYGWKCIMTHYERRENKETNKVGHGYVFTFSRIVPIFDPTSDMPF